MRRGTKEFLAICSFSALLLGGFSVISCMHHHDVLSLLHPSFTADIWEQDVSAGSDINH